MGHPLAVLTTRRRRTNSSADDGRRSPAAAVDQRQLPNPQARDGLVVLQRGGEQMAEPGALRLLRGEASDASELLLHHLRQRLAAPHGVCASGRELPEDLLEGIE